MPNLHRLRRFVPVYIVAVALLVLGTNWLGARYGGWLLPASDDGNVYTSLPSGGWISHASPSDAIAAVLHENELHSLPDLPKLQNLTISGAATLNARLDQLQRFPRLEYLHVQLPLDETGVAHLAGLKPLVVLTIGNYTPGRNVVPTLPAQRRALAALNQLRNVKKLNVFLYRMQLTDVLPKR